MEITFNHATANDIEVLFELNKKLIEKYETNLNHDFEKIYSWVKRKLENNIKSYQCIYFDGIKVGYFYLHNDGEKLELDDLYIFDEFQGGGIGTRVLKYVASIAAEKNKAVFLYVFAKNHGAIRLYLRNGYEIVKNIDDSRYIMST
ncbi:MAG: GCN5-related N-acetyltransferase [Clostridiales bacterium]|jgi:ribosomal protein S18 acetylase RimI-like enzyme|nr:GCN5-related N-acetyltransferase [Clostridiales bacterium]